MNMMEFSGLTNLDPANVRQFMRSRGWQHTHEVMPGVHEYLREDLRIDVPARGYIDFPRRMAELVELLAFVHQVEVLTLLDDLTTPSGDIVELRIDSPTTRDGTLPLEDSARFRQAQKDLVLAAAHSAIQPGPHFPRMSQKEAVELLSRCREGQTARGSYCTRVIIPVEPQVGQTADIEPFGRRVTSTLAGAVLRAVQAVETDKFSDLLTSYQHGISVNLLQSLAALAPPGGGGSVELAVRWSLSRTAPAEVPRVRIGPGAFPFFLQAARELRAISPEVSYSLEGYVVRLARRPDVEAGQVVVMEETEEEGTRKVQVRLSGDAYDQAVEAHRSSRPLRIIGTLRRVGRLYELEGALAPTVMPEEEPIRQCD